MTSVVVAGGEQEEGALREAAAALGVELESVEAPAPPAGLFSGSSSVPSASEADESEAEEGEEGERAATAAAAGANENDEALRRGLEDIFWTREAPEPEATRGRALGGRAAEVEVNDGESDDDDDDGVRPEDREE